MCQPLLAAVVQDWVRFMLIALARVYAALVLARVDPASELGRGMERLFTLIGLGGSQERKRPRRLFGPMISIRSERTPGPGIACRPKHGPSCGCRW
jgi:hypothetical protein